MSREANPHPYKAPSALGYPPAPYKPGRQLAQQHHLQLLLLHRQGASSASCLTAGTGGNGKSRHLLSATYCMAQTLKPGNTTWAFTPHACGRMHASTPPGVASMHACPAQPPHTRGRLLRLLLLPRLLGAINSARQPPPPAARRQQRRVPASPESACCTGSSAAPVTSRSCTSQGAAVGAVPPSAAASRAHPDACARLPGSLPGPPAEMLAGRPTRGWLAPARLPASAACRLLLRGRPPGPGPAGRSEEGDLYADAASAAASP